MTPRRSDPVLYILMKDDLLKLSGDSVDDLLRVRDEGFEEIFRRTCKEFDMEDDQLLPCTFNGFALRHDENNINVHEKPRMD